MFPGNLLPRLIQFIELIGELNHVTRGMVLIRHACQVFDACMGDNRSGSSNQTLPIKLGRGWVTRDCVRQILLDELYRVEG